MIEHDSVRVGPLVDLAPGERVTGACDRATTCP